jgi:hypothetical protein
MHCIGSLDPMEDPMKVSLAGLIAEPPPVNASYTSRFASIAEFFAEIPLLYLKVSQISL